MNRVHVFNRQTKAIALLAVLLVATLVSTLASAATITARSIELSSSSKAATGVSYKVDFTAVGSATGFVIDFCSNTPLLGQACTPPPGLSVTAATTSDATKDGTNTTANKFVGTKAISAGAQTITLAGVTNPTAAGTIYARIVTFNSNGQENYNSTTTGASNPGPNVVDDGGVAIAITDTVAVSGAVLESLTFCLSGAAIPKDCDTGNGGAALTAPVLVLGENTGGVVALNAQNVSTGTVNTQISTNAVSGAVIRLKSSASDCGGLVRAGAASNTAGCGIAPALNTGISAGQAKFGVRTGAVTDSATVTDASGTLQAVSGSNYNDTTYVLNYAAGNATGITSVFGDPFLDTNNAPINNKNMALTFGASVSNNTPAGLYSANLSMIATGKF